MNKFYKFINIISEKEHYVIAQCIAEARSILGIKLRKEERYIKDNYTWTKHKYYN